MATAGGGLVLGTLFIDIEARAAGAITSLTQFGTQTGLLIDEQKTKWAGLAETGQALSGVGAALTAGLTAPIVGFGIASIKAAGDFQASMNTVSALGDIYGKELQGLADAALKFGQGTKFSAQEAADAMAELAAKGFNATEILEAMPGIINLATAGQLELADASNIATNTLNQYGLGLSKSGMVADVLAKGAADSAANVQQLGQSLKYVGPIASGVGMSLQDTVGILAALSNTGIEATKAGTSLRGIIASLSKPTKQAAADLDRLGVSTTDASGKLRPLDDIFLQLQKSGASMSDMFTIFGRQGATAAETLTKMAGPALQQFINDMNNSTGEAQRMTDILNQGVNFQLKQIKSSVSTAATELGNALTPAFIAVAEAVRELVNWLTQGIKWFEGLPDPVKAGVEAFIAFAAVLGPLVLTLGSIFTAIGVLMPGLEAIAVFFGTSVGLLAPWALAIAGVGAALTALGVWVYEHWGEITAALSVAWDEIKPAWEAFSQWVAAWWGAIWEGVKLTWDVVMGPYIPLLEGIWDPLKGKWGVAWDLIVTPIRDAVVAIAILVRELIQPIKELVDVASALPGVGDQFAGLKKAVDQLASASEKLAISAASVKSPVDEMAASWDKVKNAKADELIKNQTVQFLALAKELGSAGAAIAALGAKGAALKPTLEELTRQTITLHNGMADASNKGKDWSGDLAKLKSGVNALEAQIKSATPAIAGHGGALGTATDATDALTTSSDLLTGALRRGSQATKEFLTPLQWIDQQAAALDKTIGAGLNTTFVAAGKNIGDLTYLFAAGKPPAQEFTAALQAVGAAATTAGADATEAMGTCDASIETLKTGAATKLPAVKGYFDTFATDVGHTVSNLADNFARDLFEGDGSWAEKGKKALTQLGEAVLEAFLKPATKAIGDFIGGALADLLGGGGFGGLLDSIKGIGSAFGGLFSSVGSAASGAGEAAAGAGEAAGGVASSVGGILGSVTSILNPIGAIGSVVSAITGVLSLFGVGQEGQKDRLNNISDATKYVAWAIDTGGMRTGVLDIKSATENLLSAFGGWYHDALVSWMGTTEELRDRINIMQPDLANASSTLMQIADAQAAGIDQESKFFDSMLSAIEGMADQLTGLAASDKQLSMNLYGTDPTTVAASIATQLRLQGAA